MTLFDEAPGDRPVKRERAGGWIVLLVLVLLALLAGGGYALAHQVAADKVPLGTTVSGIDIGGMTRSAAIAELQEKLGARAAQPLHVEVAGGRSADVRPDEIGLQIDYEATIDAVSQGESWRPDRQWDYFTGGDDADAVVDVDESQLADRLGELTTGLGVPPKDGAVTFGEDGVSVVNPVPGEAVDLDAARDAITAAFLGEQDSAELTVTTAEPDIDDADVQAALDGFANPAMSSSVTLVFGRSQVRLQPRQYATALSMVPDDGVLVPRIDERRITRLVKSATTTGEPVDASVELVDGKPRIVKAKPGVSFDPADVVRVFTDLLTAAEGDRSGEVEATVEEASFTTADARALGIKQKISEFTTYYPYAEYRNINIPRAAELIDGTLLKPGETFSLNDTVGERTKENGFTIGYTIQGGILKLDYGGGVSQMATTTFNAAFFAGLEDVEHKPHSFYIDRYPEGREATVAWPTVDLRFKNDTPYGVLIHASVTPATVSAQGIVTVQIFSTKLWDIESKTGPRYNYRAPVTRHLTTPDCEAFTGYSGFDVDVTRIFRKHGEDAIDHTEKLHTSYTAADSVVCGPPPKTDSP
ncbi:VanW family protein [Nocardioides sp. MH1]|uniref:VanW family protein n=1 Tax=Nocardioides sp. MH1 TaxID=3242490 RepID=UPI00352021E5